MAKNKETVSQKYKRYVSELNSGVKNDRGVIRPLTAQERQFKISYCREVEINAKLKGKESPENLKQLQSGRESALFDIKNERILKAKEKKKKAEQKALEKAQAKEEKKKSQSK